MTHCRVAQREKLVEALRGMMKNCLGSLYADPDFVTTVSFKTFALAQETTSGSPSNENAGKRVRRYLSIVTENVARLETVKLNGMIRIYNTYTHYAT